MEFPPSPRSAIPARCVNAPLDIAGPLAVGPNAARIDLALADVVDGNLCGPAGHVPTVTAHILRAVGDVVVAVGLERVPELGAVDIGELVLVELDLGPIDVLPVDVVHYELVPVDIDVVEAIVDVDVAVPVPASTPPVVPVDRRPYGNTGDRSGKVGCRWMIVVRIGIGVIGDWRRRIARLI
ncbi:hypothetical protein T190_10265 [Sinorhizobium meliloti CCBAU 01290]|nr:hypothetical protein T190_10265 [Sinorhizobium meliloti CCBAU 01290]